MWMLIGDELDTFYLKHLQCIHFYSLTSD